MKKFILLLSTLVLFTISGFSQVPTPFLANGQQKCVGSTVVYGPSVIDPALTYSFNIIPAQPFTSISGGDQIQVTWNTVGVYNIETTVTNADGCTSSSISIITIVPTLNIVVTDQVACQNSNPFALISNPTGVTWAGVGVVGNNFNPSGLAPGVYPITATFIDANGCQGSGNGIITITPLPPPPTLNSDN